MNPSLAIHVQLACLFEATARKPGNVHRLRDFPGLSYVDFLTAAAVVAPILGDAVGKPLGDTILACVHATRRITGKNPNLGVVLLLAPLAAAGRTNPDAVGEVLNDTTVEDAAKVYRAIRIAQPGGMGRVDEQDLDVEPTLPLLDVMRLAAERDLIARQYANGFADVFAGVTLLSQSIDVTWESAVVRLHLTLMAEHGDSHVGRLRGAEESRELQALSRRAVDGEREELDRWFAAGFPDRNPGTTADLVAACLFVALRQGIIALPLERPWSEPL